MKCNLKPKLIALMRNTGVGLYSAARIVGVNPATTWRWRHTDDVFAREIIEVRARNRAKTFEAQFEALKASFGEVECHAESSE